MSRDANTALHKLPPSVFRELVERLSKNQKIKPVVRWLMRSPRGELQHEGHYIMRKHVIALRDCLQEGKIEGAASTPNSQLTRQEAFKPANRSAPPTTRTMIHYCLVDIEDLWREIEEQEGNKDTRVQQKIQLLQTHLRFIAESNKADIVELAQRKACGHTSLLDTFEAMDLDGNFLAAPAPKEVVSPEREAELKELREGFAKMPASDRMLARHELGLLRRILKLRKEIAKEEAEAPSAPPNEPQP